MRLGAGMGQHLTAQHRAGQERDCGEGRAQLLGNGQDLGQAAEAAEVLRQADAGQADVLGQQAPQVHVEPGRRRLERADRFGVAGVGRRRAHGVAQFGQFAAVK